DLQIAVAESCVTQPAAKLELRAEGGVAVTRVFCLKELVIVSDQAIGRAWIAKRKSAVRVVIAEENIGNRGPAFITWDVGHENSACALDDPVNDARSAFDQYEHNGLAGGFDSFRQFQLRFAERQVRDIAGSFSV